MQTLEWSDLPGWLAQPQDTVLLAASDVQAAEFRRQQLVAGPGWERLQCLPVDQWLVACWDRLLPDRQVLRPLQLQAMAERVLADHPWQEADILHRDALLRQFLSAFERAEQYQLPEDNAFALSADQQAFQIWRRQLKERLDESACLALCQLPTALQAEARNVAWPQRLLLLPGLELNPAQRALIDLAETAGLACYCCESRQSEPSSETALSFDSPDAEVEAAARWIAERGDRRLAIVASEARYWPLLERKLWQMIDSDAPCWRGSHMRLSDLPEALVAWDLSALLGDRLEWEALSRVLRSDTFGLRDELFYQRCELDMAGRERLRSGLSFRELRRFASRIGDRLDHWFEQITEYRPAQQRLSPSHWVRQLEGLLSVCGWPRQGLEDTAHRGVMKALNETLDVLRSMDRFTGDIDLAAFRRWWWRLMSGKRFNPVCQDQYSVWMLSPEQCAGLSFDAIWVLGMSEACWPAASRPLAMLDITRQRQLDMPLSSPAACLRDARRQQEQWRAAAGEIIYSCAIVSEDGVEQLPSAVIGQHWQHQASFSAEPGLALLQRDKDGVPAVSAAEVERWGGGTGLFKAQALSPFIGFCRHRLGLRELALPQEGLDAATQGQCLHDALELIWQQLGSSEALAALNEEQLRSLIRGSVQEALQRHAPEGRFGAVLIRLEQLRLQALLDEWFEWERSRTEPFEVIALEQEQHLRVGDIGIRARLDRLDRIGDKRLVMDYKSGKVVASKLNAGNLLEPQLPLYAVFAQGEPCSGLALAQIHAQGISVHVRSDWTKTLAPGTRATHAVGDAETWQQEKIAWSKRLEAIAAQILSGDIRHDPGAAADELRFHEALSPLWRFTDAEPPKDAASGEREAGQ